MRIILLGAPGSGKGTQARFIMEQYAIPQISVGDILRSVIKSGSKIGRKAKIIMNEGKLINDELVISLVKEKIKKEEICNGFILDGFPRTPIQANSLKKKGIKIDYVLEFHVPDELLIERIVGRRIHLPSGRVYHITLNPPKEKGKDDITGEALTIRKDDQKETAWRRLAEYHKLTKSLIYFYQNEAKKNNTKYYKIDGTKKITEVNNEIMKILR